MLPSLFGGLSFGVGGASSSNGPQIFNAGSVFGNATATTALPDAAVNAAVSQSSGGAKWYWILVVGLAAIGLVWFLKRK